VDPRAGLGDVEKRKILTLPGLKLQPVANRSTDYAIPAPSIFKKLLYSKIWAFLENDVLIPVQQCGFITGVKVTLHIPPHLMLVVLIIVLFRNRCFDNVHVLLMQLLELRAQNAS
jgi:hypothetical protein